MDDYFHCFMANLSISIFIKEQHVCITSSLNLSFALIGTNRFEIGERSTELYNRWITKYWTIESKFLYLVTFRFIYFYWDRLIRSNAVNGEMLDNSCDSPSVSLIWHYYNEDSTISNLTSSNSIQSKCSYIHQTITNLNNTFEKRLYSIFYILNSRKKTLLLYLCITIYTLHFLHHR